MRRYLLLPVLAALVAGTFAALGGNTTLFSSTLGDLVFPFSPPAADGSAGSIDNMTLGVTTPRAVSGTTGTFTGAVTGTTGTFSGTVTGSGIAAASGQSVSGRVFHTGGVPAIASTSGNDSTPVATEVYIAEVFVPANVTLTGAAVFNGSVASGNMKVGLADSTGAVVATSASTAMSGTDAYQRVAFTATYAAKGPATYYVLQFLDNTTARINTHVVGNFGAAKQAGQTYATGFTAITPPTTFTTALGPIATLY